MGLSDRLRAQTRTTHQGVDDAIMAAKPFASPQAYGRFLKVQHGIHFDVAPLYDNTELARAFLDLSGRGRLHAVEQDLADLGIDCPEIATPPATASIDMPQALGWLYVVEGSNLGAAFLLKYARKMGLSETHGARHLAEPPEGRAPYWKTFKTALNAVDLTANEDARAIAGAQDAFARVRALIHTHL
jgi:heme oxygenase